MLIIYQFHAIIGIVICSIVLGNFINLHKMTNNWCLPVSDPGKRMLIVPVIGITVAIVQISTIVGTIIMNKMVKTSIGKSAANFKPKYFHSIKKSIILHTILVTASHCLCWIPSSIIYITALIMDLYPINMIYWTTAVVVPINPILIPIILIINT